MARIQCGYIGCVFLDDGFCSTPTIQLDPDEGCLTFTRRGRQDFEDDWEDDDDELADFQEEGFDDDWLEDDDDDDEEEEEEEDDFDF